nr:hypothetical protein [Clostridiales bacterium]
MTDWKAIREEYVVGRLGMRPLAEKCGVSFNTLKDHAAREGWSEKRREYRKMKEQLLAPATTFPCASPPDATPQNSENVVDCTEPEPLPGAEMIYRVSEMMLSRIRTLLPRCGSMYELRSAASALEDIKGVLMSHPSLEVEEQRARIERLRAEIREREKSHTR